MAEHTHDPDWWRYERLESKAPYDWSPSVRGDDEYDLIDFHIDLGCGTVPKARLGIDRFPAPGVDLVIDLDRLVPADPAGVVPGGGVYHKQTLDQYKALGLAAPRPIGDPQLPFPDNSIHSIISHHCLEHIGDGFIRLMDECHRVLQPGGVFRIIVPLFPSYSAIADPDHKRYFLEEVFETFCGSRDGRHWMESFSVPYTKCRFEMLKEDISPPTPAEDQWRAGKDAREMRVALRKWA